MSQGARVPLVHFPGQDAEPVLDLGVDPVFAGPLEGPSQVRGRPQRLVRLALRPHPAVMPA